MQAPQRHSTRIRAVPERFREVEEVVIVKKSSRGKKASPAGGKNLVGNKSPPPSSSSSSKAGKGSRSPSKSSSKSPSKSPSKQQQQQQQQRKKAKSPTKKKSPPPPTAHKSQSVSRSPAKMKVAKKPKQLSYSQSALDAAGVAMGLSGGRKVSKTDAKRLFALNDNVLDNTPYMEKTNPMEAVLGQELAPMRLYSIGDLKEALMEYWGAEDMDDAELHLAHALSRRKEHK